MSYDEDYKQNMAADTVAVWILRLVGFAFCIGIFVAAVFAGFNYWPDVMPWVCGIGSGAWVLLWAVWRVHMRPRFGDGFNPYRWKR